MIDALLQVDWPLEELWSTAVGFILIFVTTVGVIGLGSGSMTIAAYAAYMVFAYFAMEVGDPLLTNLLYISLVVINVGLGFKLIRLEAWGD